MIAFLVRRVLQAAVALVLISMLVFGFLWLLPGGPQQAILAAAGSGAPLGALRHDYGIGSPVVVEYLHWLGQVVHGNLGYSYVENASVGSLLATSLPRTLALTLTATAIGMAVAIPAGLTQAVRRDTAGDRLARALSYIGYGMPSFFLGAILILIFAVRLRWLGAEGPQSSGIVGVLTDWRDMTLPVITLAVVTVATFSRYVRTAAVDSLGHDYVRTARAGGSGPRGVLRRHVLRNSLIPVISLAGMSIPRILAGALVVESLFNIQGMGWRLWQAAQQRDFPVLIGFILVIGAGAVVGSLLADACYMIADPRVRHGRP
ncbi:MAG TPA: ABC transporter permease [Streptosporangiaceae bacterium]|nr:ABC transporter permease [Streptosporangiaceae bacterium]